MVQKLNGNDARLRQFLRETFRADRQVNERLGPLKQMLETRPASEFLRIFSAFKTVAPITHRNLTTLGAKHAWDLVWLREPFPVLDVADALKWASRPMQNAEKPPWPGPSLFDFSSLHSRNWLPNPVLMPIEWAGE